MDKRVAPLANNPDHCEVCGLVPFAPGLRGGAEVIAKSPAMQTLLKRAARFAATEAPVVVLGETGSGKEVVARTLHANSSRARQPFVAVNVAALPAELLESELFGHGKGAFTGAGVARQGLFEAAHGGTLFLDEIGEMPLALQAKLLRVLQDGEVRRIGENVSFAVDVRIVCATHRDLALQVADGFFRQDLFYRLKVLTLHVPPLRNRVEDIMPLACHYLASERGQVSEFAEGEPGFSAETETILLSYGWPGNVRELQNVVKHGAALAERGAIIGAKDLPDELLTQPLSKVERVHSAGVFAKGELREVGAAQTLAEVERQHILQVLETCRGSQSEAAIVLGIARNTLWRKLRKYT